MTTRYDAIKQRGDRWTFVMRLPGSNGESKQQRFTFSTEKEARRKFDELQHKKHTGEALAASRMSLADYMERWLTDYAEGNTTAKTCQEYRKLTRTHIKTHIGHIQLDRLRTTEIQRMYTTLRSVGRLDGKGGLSPQTVILVHRCLSKALKTAVEWQELPRNPATGARPGKREETKLNVLDGEQTLRLWKLAEGTGWRLPVLLATTTGMRRSEILALKWDDIDLEQGTLVVDESLEQTKEHGIRFKPPKTRSGRRTLPLMPFVTEALREHRVEQLRHRSELGNYYQDQNLVLAGPEGKPISPNGFSGRFTEFMRRHPELPPVRFHDLRHSVASLLAAINENPAKVKELLGHHDIGITLRFYSHLYPGALRETSANLEAVYRRAGEG